MFVSYRHQFVFIEIPRTASRALGEALANIHHLQAHPCKRGWWKALKALGLTPNKGYVQLPHHRLLIPENAKGFFTFACVRNPYAREVSHYLYRKTRNYNNMFEQVSQWSFADYVNWVTDTPETTAAELEKQSLNIGKPGADLHDYPQSLQLAEKRLDKVIHFERLTDECYSLPFWPEGLVLPKKNANLSYDWKSYYNQELADLVYEWCCDDFNRFNYEKDSWRQN